MPVQLTSKRFVQLKYDPDYLKEYPHLRTEDGASLLDLTKGCRRSNLVIDGGNIVCWDDAAILTEKIFKENPRVSLAELPRQLKTALKVDRLAIIPAEPGDRIGHSDGVLRFIDHDTVLVNDYAEIEPGYGRRLATTLARHGLKSIPFPYCPTDEPGTDPGIPSAIGCYINFLQTHDTICVPAFGLAADKYAAKILGEVFLGYRVIKVRCRRLAKKGGVLNCVTWNVKIDESHPETE
jgi:agmatine deiminase